jgi:hypothetical protein
MFTLQSTCRRAAMIAFLALLAPAVGLAQTPGGSAVPPPDLKKWDATGTTGWHNRPIDSGLYKMRGNSLFAGVTLGRYWTENVKTEVEVATGGRADGMYFDASFTTTPYTPPASLTVSNFQVSAGQLYQFFHNAWFHPFAGAGVVYERQHYQASRIAQQVPTYSYSNGTTTTQWISVPAWSKDWNQPRLSGFVLAGFKGYVAQHAFFRADFRLAMKGGVQTVNTRLGFGIDF